MSLPQVSQRHGPSSSSLPQVQSPLSARDSSQSIERNNSLGDEDDAFDDHSSRQQRIVHARRRRLNSSNANNIPLVVTDSLPSIQKVDGRVTPPMQGASTSSNGGPLQPIRAASQAREDPPSEPQRAAPGWKAQYGLNLPLAERVADLVKAESYVRATNAQEEQACKAPIIEIWKVMVRALYGDEYAAAMLTPTGSPEKSVKSSPDQPKRPVSSTSDGHEVQRRKKSTSDQQTAQSQSDGGPSSAPGSRTSTPPAVPLRAVPQKRLLADSPDAPPVIPTKAAPVAIDLNNPQPLGDSKVLSRGSLSSLVRTEQYNRNTVQDHEASSWSNIRVWQAEQAERNKQYRPRDKQLLEIHSVGALNPHQAIALVSHLRQTHVVKLVLALTEEEEGQRADIVAECDISMQYAILTPMYSALASSVLRQETNKRGLITMEQERVFFRDTGMLHRVEALSQTLKGDFLMSGESLLRDSMMALAKQRQEMEAAAHHIRLFQSFETTRRTEIADDEAVLTQSALTWKGITAKQIHLLELYSTKTSLIFTECREQIDRHINVELPERAHASLAMSLHPLQRGTCAAAETLRKAKENLYREAVSGVLLNSIYGFSLSEQSARSDLSDEEFQIRKFVTGVLQTLAGMSRACNDAVHETVEYYQQSDHSISSLFADIANECPVVQKAFRDTFFGKPLQPIKVLNLTEFPMTSRTISYVFQTFGAARCSVDHVIVLDGHRDAIQLLKLDVQCADLAGCAIRDEDCESGGVLEYLDTLGAWPQETTTRLETINLSRNLIRLPKTISKFISLAKRCSGIKKITISLSGKQKDEVVDRLQRVLDFVTFLNQIAAPSSAYLAISATFRSQLVALAESAEVTEETSSVNAGVLLSREVTHATVQMMESRDAASRNKSNAAPTEIVFPMAKMRQQILELLVLSLRTNTTLQTLTISQIGLTDDDVFAAGGPSDSSILSILLDASICPRLHMIDLSMNLLSLSAIERIESTIRQHRPLIVLLVTGNLHWSDIESSVQQAFESAETAEAQEFSLITSAHDTLIQAFRGFYELSARMEEFSTKTTFFMENIVEERKRMAKIFGESVLAMQEERAALKELQEAERITCERFFHEEKIQVEKFLVACARHNAAVQVLEDVMQDAVDGCYAIYEVQMKEALKRLDIAEDSKFCMEFVAPKMHHAPAFYESQFVLFQRLCDEALALARVEYDLRRERYLKQPKALREAIDSLSLSAPLGESRKAVTLDLSEAKSTEPRTMDPAAMIDLNLLEEVVMRSQETTHPIRGIVLRNCDVIINIDSALPLLLSLCSTLETLDLTNCGLTNRHIEALCDVVSQPASSSAVRRLVLEGAHLSVSGLSSILHALKNSSPEISRLEEISIGDITVALSKVHPQSQTAELLQSISFFNRLNKAIRSHAFKAKIIAIYDNHPFFVTADFSNSYASLFSVCGVAGLTPFRGARAIRNSPPVSRDNSPSRGLSGVRMLFADPIVDSGTPASFVGSTTPGLGHTVIVDDYLMEFILQAMARNTHVRQLTVSGNEITDLSVRRLIAHIAPQVETMTLQEVDVNNNLASEGAVDELTGLFFRRVYKKLREQIISPEEIARIHITTQLLSQWEIVVRTYRPMSDYLHRIAPIESHCRQRKRIVVNELMFSGDLRACVRDEADNRKSTNREYEHFASAAAFWIDHVVKIGFLEQEVSRKKNLLFDDNANLVDNTKNVIDGLPAELRATATHVARNNPFVSIIDVSAEATCITAGDRAGTYDDTIEAVWHLMRRNTSVNEMSFANAGPFINSNRSIPLIAELGVRLETLDLTNCGVSDALIGSLAVMIADPKCQMKTLVLDGNKITAKGAQRLAKAIRASASLSSVSLENNTNLPNDAGALIQFYCDLNKFTPSFKETILRVEANDPTLLDIDFERRGNTDERTIFDDTSMRLLSAALPHNTHVRRLYISGNHVTDDGASVLLGILKGNLNRNVFFIDLSGNDVSQPLLDEIETIRLVRTQGVVRVEVIAPEASLRDKIIASQADEHLSHILLFPLMCQHAESAAEYRRRMSELFTLCANSSKVEVDAVIPEAMERSGLLQNEVELNDLLWSAQRHLHWLTSQIHDSHFTEAQKLFSLCVGGFDHVRTQLEAQPNAELSRVAIHLATNDPTVTHVDISSKPSDNDFCIVGDLSCSSETVQLLSTLLEKNTVVTSIDFSYNDELTEEAYQTIMGLSNSMQGVNMSHCGLTDEYVPRIVSLLTSDSSTLSKINLDGNLFSNDGAKMIERALSHSGTAQSRKRVRSVTMRGCSSVLDITEKAVEFYCELNQCPDLVRLFILDVIENDPIIVEGAHLPLSDAQLRLLCFALSRNVNTRAVKLQGSQMSENGMLHLGKVFRQKRDIQHLEITVEGGTVDECTLQISDILEMSSKGPSTRSVADVMNILRTRLSHRVDEEVIFVEDASRALLVETSKQVRLYMRMYRNMQTLFAEHERQVAILYAISLGGQAAVQAVVQPEVGAREDVQLAEIQARKEIRLLMNFFYRSAVFYDTVIEKKIGYATESKGAVQQVASMMPGLPLELRAKAFCFALNDPTATSLDLSAAYSDKAMWVLSKVLKLNQHCTALNFSSSDIRLNFALPLLAEAKANIELLDLSNCDLDDTKFLDPIREFLFNPDCKLVKVLMDRNRITGTALNGIATTVRDNNHTLVEFSAKHNKEMTKLRQNTMDYYCELNRYIQHAKQRGRREDYIKVKQLLIDCQNNKSHITTLNFANEEGMQALILDDQFAKLVCIALANNTHVRCVNLRRHSLTDRGAEYFLQLMRGINYSLQTVMLDGNLVSPGLLMQIDQVVPARELEALCEKDLAVAKEGVIELYQQHEKKLKSDSHKQGNLWLLALEARQVPEDSEYIQRTLFNRFSVHLKFYAAWIKSYEFSFEKEYRKAYGTLGNITPQVLERAATLATLRASYGADPAFHRMPFVLRERFDRYVYLAHMYEQKCIKVVQLTYDKCADEAKKFRPAPSTFDIEYENSALNSNAFSFTEEPSSGAPKSSAQSWANLQQTFGAPKDDIATTSFSYDSANGGDDQSSRRRSTPNNFALAAQAVRSNSLTGRPRVVDFGSPSNEHSLQPESLNSFDSTPSFAASPSSSALTPSRSVYDPFSQAKDDALTAKLQTKMEQFTTRLAAFELRCTNLLTTCFQNYANSVPNPPIVHGFECKPSCICSVTTKPRLRLGSVLEEKLFIRFNKYCEQTSKFSEFCIQALESVFVQAVRELPNIPRPKKLSFDVVAMNARMESRLEKYLAALRVFEEKCVAALSSTFDSHVASSTSKLDVRQRVNSMSKPPLVTKLEQRFLAYTISSGNFEEKCHGAQADLFETACRRHGLDRIPQYGMYNMSVQQPDASAPSSPAYQLDIGAHPVAHKLHQRLEKYTQALATFELKCKAAVEALFGTEVEKLNLKGSPHASSAFSPTLERYNSVYGGSTPFPTRSRSQESEASDLQSSASASPTAKPSMWQKAAGVKTAVALASQARKMSTITDTNVLQALEILPNQPPELRIKGELLATNDPSVTIVDLSERTNSCLMDDKNITVLWTLLSSNTCVKTLRLSVNFGELNNGSMTRIGRLAVRIPHIDLSGSKGVTDVIINKMILPLLSKDTMESLILDNVDLTSDHVAALLNCLRSTSHKLTTLSIKNNPKVDQVMTAFSGFYTDVNKFNGASDTFKTTIVGLEANNPDVKSVMFAGTLPGTGFVNDMAARLICISLSQNKHVREINIANCQVSDRGAKNLITLLKDVNNASSLRYLNISGNKLSQAVALEMTEVATKHRPKMKMLV